MRAEDIVEGLNRHIDTKRKEKNILSNSHLVLQRIIEPHPTFKAYKTYTTILWFVNGRDKYEIISFSHTAKVLNGEEKSVERYINTTLSYLIYNWIGSNSYMKVIKGDYEIVKV